MVLGCSKQQLAGPLGCSMLLQLADISDSIGTTGCNLRIHDAGASLESRIDHFCAICY